MLLNKPRFDQISSSRRCGKRWQYGVHKRYEIVKGLGTPAVKEYEFILAMNQIGREIWHTKAVRRSWDAHSYS